MKTAIALSVIQRNGWNNFTGTELPQRVFDMIKKSNGFQCRGASWCMGAVYYKGDIETTNDWIVTTDDGGYYKVGAEFMIWHPGKKSGEFNAQAIWSTAALKRSLKSLVEKGSTVADPGYQS